MKIVLMWLFCMCVTYPQNITVGFTCTGAGSVVDSVKVENLTQCTATSLGGSEVLRLSGSLGVTETDPVTGRSSVRIYPNPMMGNCFVDFSTSVPGGLTLTLYNILGQKIFTEDGYLSEGHHTYQVSGVSAGIYILLIESKHYMYTAKITNLKSSGNRLAITHLSTQQEEGMQNTTSTPVKKNASGSGMASVIMQYNPGDLLKLTGNSGVYRSVFMLRPTMDTIVPFSFVPCMDADGNNYSVVKIGTQIWMAECMKSTRFNDGTAIPNITDNYAYWHLSTPAFSWYNNDSTTYKKTYGALYNWYVVETQNICPTGWHVPDSSEWDKLFSYLGGENVAGGKMKEACTPYWWTPNVGATNISGFSGIPGGSRDGYTDGNFYNIGEHCYSWSSTEYDTENARFGDLTYSDSMIWMRDMTYKRHGFSIRCLKD